MVLHISFVFGYCLDDWDKTCYVHDFEEISNKRRVNYLGGRYWGLGDRGVPRVPVLDKCVWYVSRINERKVHATANSI